MVFRSPNSKPVKLPFEPSTDLYDLLKVLYPTQKGISIHYGTLKIKDIIKKRNLIFGLKSEKRVVSSILLRDFIKIFGKYETIRLEQTLEELTKSWNKDIEK